jgi:hypothetical protein
LSLLRTSQQLPLVLELEARSANKAKLAQVDTATSNVKAALTAAKFADIKAMAVKEYVKRLST